MGLGSLLTLGAKLVGKAQRVEEAIDAVKAAKDKLQGKDRRGLDAKGKVKVAVGAKIAFGGNAMGMMVLAVLIEWSLVPEKIMQMPQSLALAQALLGSLFSILINLYRKWSTKYPDLAAAMDEVLKSGAEGEG